MAGKKNRAGKLRSERSRTWDDNDDNDDQFLTALKYLEGDCTAVTIHKLGAEILTRIFVILSEEASNSQWVVALRVCRYWLCTALLAPALWTRIRMAPDYLGVGYIELCLRRSRRLPLELLVEEPKASHKAGLPDVENMVVQLIAKEAHRIRVLRLHCKEAYLSRVVPEISMPMPNLEVLVLGDPDGWRDPDAPALPIAFSADQFPKLRSLALSEIDVVWEPFNLHALTTLALREVKETSRMETMLVILEACSNLETLIASCPSLPEESVAENDEGSEDGYADDDDDGPEPTYPPPLRSLSLPRIRSLQLEGELEETGWLLSHLILPASAVIEIRGPLEVGMEYERTPYIMAAIPADASNLPCIARLRSVILDVEEGGAEVRGFAAASRDGSGPQDCLLHMVFSDWVASRSFGYLLPWLAMRAATFFQGFDITELRLHGRPDSVASSYMPDGDFSESQFKTVLEFLPCLERLELDLGKQASNCFSVRALFEALAVPSSTKSILCPRLHTLVLGEMQGAGVQSVLKSLGSRSDRGARLKLLSLPIHLDGDLAKLRKVVDTVHISLKSE